MLERLRKLAPEVELNVFTFREDPWEPPFLDSIQKLAQQVGAKFYECRSLNVPSMAWLKSAPIDLILAVNWRYMIPPSVYRHARLGSFVFHDSMLPQYRGFAPTVWAIRNGETATGVTLFEMAEKVDSGDIVDQQRVAIGPDDAIAEVAERVTEAYLAVLERNIAQLLEGTAPRMPQDHNRATYACKLMPADMQIDWNAPTREIYDLIRSYTTPYPGAYTWFDGRKVHILAAKPVDQPLPYVGRIPGRPAEIRPREGVVVVTGDGEILLTHAKFEGEIEARCAAEVITRMSSTLGSHSEREPHKQ